MGPLPRKGNMKQKITDYLDEIYDEEEAQKHKNQWQQFFEDDSQNWKS